MSQRSQSRYTAEFLEPGSPTHGIAHRGFSGAVPENTLAAFRAALELEVDMLELDVTWTREHELVVIHDDPLDRTTSGSIPVAEAACAEVRALEAGSWFDARFADERVPTLDEVLELARGHALLNVEIKEQVVGPEAADGIVERA